MVGTMRPRWSVVLPRPFEGAQREMDHLFDSVFGNGNGSAGGLAAPASLWEEQDRWCIEVDLPGVRQEDVEITHEKQTLRIAAERKAPEGERNYAHNERSYGRVDRLISLPETVDPEKIEAELKDGVLLVTLAKRPEVQPKKINVKVS